MRPPGHTGRAKKGHLIFDAAFESGNLGRVDRINDFEYDLFVRPDLANPRFRFWFNFTIENVQEGQRILLNIVNLGRKCPLFFDGFTPVIRSTSRGKWQRIPSENVFYYRCPYHRLRFVLTLALAFDNEEDVYQLALSYPYTYTRLKERLNFYEVLTAKSNEGRSYFGDYHSRRGGSKSSMAGHLSPLQRKYNNNRFRSPSPGSSVFSRPSSLHVTSLSRRTVSSSSVTSFSRKDRKEDSSSLLGFASLSSLSSIFFRRETIAKSLVSEYFIQMSRWSSFFYCYAFLAVLLSTLMSVLNRPPKTRDRLTTPASILLIAFEGRFCRKDGFVSNTQEC